MTTLISKGESSESIEDALKNAIGGLLAQVDRIEDYILYVEGVQHTDDGFTVTVRLILLNAKELEELIGERAAPNEEENEKTGAVVRMKDKGDELDAAAYFSTQMRRREQRAMEEIAYHEIAYEQVEMAQKMPEDFGLVAHSDASYVHKAEPPAETSNDLIMTTLDENAQFADVPTYDLLSADNVRWYDFDSRREARRVSKTDLNLPADDGLNLVA